MWRPYPTLASKGNEEGFVGSRQDETFASHTHLSGGDSQDSQGIYEPDGGGAQCAAFLANNPTASAGGSETRPKNIGLCSIIRYQ